jgi:hypothetical protein
VRQLRPLTILTLVFVLVLASLAPIAAAGERLRADLEGTSIPLVDVGKHFCHDLDAPAIHCFADLAALDAAVASRTPMEVGALAVNYVRVFADRDYGGPAAYLSASYSNLGAIGWNDRISSYKVLIAGKGELREHIDYAGLIDSFCCTQWVTYVGDPYNDKYSSVRTL